MPKDVYASSGKITIDNKRYSLADDISKSKWQWDAADYTLTLDGFSSDDSITIDNLAHKLNIVIKGDNKISCASQYVFDISESNVDVVISGKSNGTLDVNQSSAEAMIKVSKNLTIKNVTMNLYSKGDDNLVGILAGGKVKLSNVAGGWGFDKAAFTIVATKGIKIASSSCNRKIAHYKSSSIEFYTLVKGKQKEFTDEDELLDAVTSNVTLKQKKAVIGDTYTKGKLKYKVLKEKKVSVCGLSDETTTNVSIPSIIKVKGTKYKVSKIAKKAFYNNSSLTNVTIKSKYIEDVGKKAFKGTADNITFKINEDVYSAVKKLIKASGVGSGATYEKL